MKYIHRKLPKVKYEPISVRDLLTTMKTISELMIDLAYSALLFSNKELGEWVMELGSEMDRLQYQLFMTLSLSVRKIEDAELSVGLFRVCVTANQVSVAAAEIALVAVIGPVIPPLFRDALLQAEEKLITGTIVHDSEISGLNQKEINDKYHMGVDITAIRRDGVWTINPKPNFSLRPEDTIFARGTGKGTNRLYELATGNSQIKKEKKDENAKELIELFLDMKETSEFMVSLAYAAVKNGDKDLVNEIASLENKMRQLHETLGKEILTLEGDVLERWSLLRIGDSLRAIATAAWEMSFVPISGLGTHPVISAIVNEAEEIVAHIEVIEDSFLANMTLEELALEDKYGVYVQSVQRKGQWIYRPLPEFRLEVGDTLIVDGYRDGMTALEQDIAKE